MQLKSEIKMPRKSQAQQSQDHNSPAWKFTFFGGTISQHNKAQRQPNLASDSPNPKLMTKQQVFPLSRFQVDDNVVIQQISSEKNMVDQLDKMHITLGAKAKVISKTPSGSIVLSIQDQQIGLGAEMANQVMVTLATSKI